VTELFPHLLRHACATHNYEGGMPLWDVQNVLGHTWASTTVGYLNPRELHQMSEKSQVS
jgi:site-specific recombinase XerD